MRKKPKDLSRSEREERGHGEGGGVYPTLIQADTVHPYGRGNEGTSPVGVELRQKPKDLSASEREERGYGEGVSTEDVRSRHDGIPTDTQTDTYSRIRPQVTTDHVLMLSRRR